LPEGQHGLHIFLYENVKRKARWGIPKEHRARAVGSPINYEKPVGRASVPAIKVGSAHAASSTGEAPVLLNLSFLFFQQDFAYILLILQSN
jgi:hypothetical protein